MIKFSKSPTRVIKKELLDEGFRKQIFDSLNSAEEEVVIITGEGQAFEYLELRLAVRDAIERGVIFKIYASSPERRPLLSNKILSYGAELYKGGKKTKHHYLIIDGKSIVVSKAHPPDTIGKRMAEVYENDPEDAKKIINYFDNLISKANPVKMRLELDPLARPGKPLYV